MKRRTFIKLSLGVGGALFFRLNFPASADQFWAELSAKAEAQGTSDILDPLTIPKFVEPLVILPAMPDVSTAAGQDGKDVLRYEIAARQFEQQILPSSLPKTTVWGYGKAGDGLPDSGNSTFHSPAYSVDVRSHQRVQVAWANHLVDNPDGSAPQFLPHLLPVDQNIHWANPANPDQMEMSKGAAPYTGPVPMVTHVHGAHVLPENDGYPEAWYLPAAANIPQECQPTGTRYASADASPVGSAVYEYPNDAPTGTLWYHDHTLGITRLSMYAGLAGFWFIRDEVEDQLDLPGPAPRLGDAPETKYYEIPLIIQDRSFNKDGSLFYPNSRLYFGDFNGPFMPDSPIPPIWNPEFFGNSMVVNGKTWPYLEVEPRLYRFRILNACNTRFLVLKFNRDLKLHQIGSDLGFLSESPAVLDKLVMAPAERADVIVDFSGLTPGDKLVLINVGPDEPYNGSPISEDALAKAETTGQVMQFQIVEKTSKGNPGQIPTTLPKLETIKATAAGRYVTLNEKSVMPEDAPSAGLLGTVNEGTRNWNDPITENPKLGDSETWTIVNLTDDAHPIHLHLVRFQVIERIPFRAEDFATAQEAYLSEDATGSAATPKGPAPNPEDFVNGSPIMPELWESGRKDTVIAYPNQLTRIRATFDLPGRYVWHCHILEHEDNEMMRPYDVIQP